MPNPILAIPIYFGLAFVPHFYAQWLVAKVDRKAYDNTNPRGAASRDPIRKALGPVTFARWERARGAHTNAFEALPLFAAAMLAGTSGHIPGTAAVAWVNLAARTVYTFLYINTTSRKTSLLRTLTFAVMSVANLVILVRAGVENA